MVKGKDPKARTGRRAKPEGDKTDFAQTAGGGMAGRGLESHLPVTESWVPLPKIYHRD